MIPSASTAIIQADRPEGHQSWCECLHQELRLHKQWREISVQGASLRRNTLEIQRGNWTNVFIYLLPESQEIYQREMCDFCNDAICNKKWYYINIYGDNTSVKIFCILRKILQLTYILLYMQAGVLISTSKPFRIIMWTLPAILHHSTWWRYNTKLQ